MNWELFVSWRFFVAKQKEHFMSLISLISILGIALGVMALIVVISVMNGFDDELREKILGLNPHLYIERDGGIADTGQLLLTLDKTQHVVAAAPFISGQALLRANEVVSGVLLRGINPQREKTVTKLEQYLVAGSLDLKDNDIIIGKELAKKFYLGLGDKITVITSSKPRQFEFNISGIFNSGMYDYDLNLVLTNIAAAQQIFKMENLVTGIGVRLDNLFQSKEIRKVLQAQLGYPYWVSDWMSMNRNLFSALQLEKTVMFVIVALIVVVACFNIAGHLIMMVMKKTKDIGILKALGASDRAIKAIFTLQGLIIGFLGTSLGAASGIILCYLLRTYKFISLPRDIYYIENLPVQMRWFDSAVIISSALLITLLAAIYPAVQAARLNPADALRYE